ncbi:1-phosphatidylinositol 4,5-bisphosphate phosphodiesterase gamma-1 isoform X1 [Thrips palmi]|uniref:1-phosphatidylinositol 4,5-bisphosphate phosphodiesterase gamma n=1 Tax=Thrips palmi TaxID=161013 RepID=A0A6P8Z2N4_THRPL|nr:1-phosphatidylinositol 4,5-bisphosphate phosphodiesterase gamma-1 isoform X1 [Thrips palmi]XP_034246749.1 1-phosphatidylinositol 4,5-bisphosphate phosphodiesterase gamma-1 isoform X1 [Thrips palmi]XP_034246750.1 1-phosphatidylinositol 4,5-bisphosphate phosphodiesterase gamma-1 isoform X1 [Thrips palmi]XP_034246751.1 1-phosphatidylinositol 4,5-bisphosphate phosphodiesterase gamma-1 isoform X1 [Thrips palmi]
MMSIPNGICTISEMEHKISQLERGCVVTIFFPRRKPESKTLQIRRETRQVLWSTARSAVNTVDLWEVKEIRGGKSSKDFEMWPEEAQHKSATQCFLILYGSQFNLKTLSIAASSEAECRTWIQALEYLLADTLNSPYPLHVDTLLRKEIYKIPGEKVTLKDMKAFLRRVNCKIPTGRLRELFNEVDTRNSAQLGFDEFSSLFHKLIFDEKLFNEHFKKYTSLTGGKYCVTIQDFQRFLLEEQHEKNAENPKWVSEVMRDFLRDSQREVKEPYFTTVEFMNFLFCKQNDLWDSSHNKVTHDMNRPLSHYWIASSHNTYLTGDQFSSPSSVEAYVRCLRMGCRCIELDCWDGPEGMPSIYHGHTFTKRIKFIDVIKTIKEHAFVTSKWPVILSIEDNCSLPQQRNMAAAMQKVFGDMLLTEPVEKNETALPSPERLKGRILIKHKKLPDGVEETSFVVPKDSSDGAEPDLRNTNCKGYLHVEDPADKEWKKFFFMLSQHKLIRIDNSPSESMDNQEEGRSEDWQDNDEESKEDQPAGFQRQKEGVPNDELHFSENWFHGKLARGRAEAEDLLHQHSHLGDGTFLVRESETFVGDYSLSFWRQGKVNHCRIRSKQEKGQRKYYLIEMNCFDNLYDLITHYHSHPLKSQEFHITLKYPVPQPMKHKGKEWFHPNVTRSQAEDMLRRVPVDGAFLVRPSGANTYALSFRVGRVIKTCRIQVEGRLYTIDSKEFESLVDLVSYYERNPLYHRVKLRKAVSAEVLRRNGTNVDDGANVYTTPGYMDPSCFTSSGVITVKALFDYQAHHDDELSFPKHAIITNVRRVEGGWWRGDYGGKRQHMFPSNYVEELHGNSDCEHPTRVASETSQAGPIDLTGATVEFKQDGHVENPWYILRIQGPNMLIPFEMATNSLEDANRWHQAIREAAENASADEAKNKQMERISRIAKEMSNLAVYCRSVVFNTDKLTSDRMVFNIHEMSSFPETQAEKIICQKGRSYFIKYHQHQLSRVYPKGSRVDSSNPDPIPLWNMGTQMVALNYQKPDKSMQLNQAKFRINGNCGYILRPDFTFSNDFDPSKRSRLSGVDPVVLHVRILSARHLTRPGRSSVSPFVEIELIGADFDSGIKLTTKPVADNGLNPTWNTDCEFEVANPNYALLRFEVRDEDMFGDPHFLGQATYQVQALKSGFRSVPLKNGYSEDLELATLLIHLSITHVQQEPSSPSLNLPNVDDQTVALLDS